jgi:hypothetical protein
MNIIKFFRKPYLAFLLSISVLTTSFSQTGSFNQDNDTTKNLSKRLITSNNEVSKLYELKAYALKNNPSPENNLTICNNWLKLNGTSIIVKNSEELKQVMNDNSIQDNIKLAINSGNYSSGEIEALNNLNENILSNDKSMQTFGQVIFKFKDDINKLDLSKEKTEFYESYFHAIDLLNTAYPDTYGYSLSKITRACAIATAALVVAFGALATIEVGSFGLATGFAVAGWLLACAAWGDACGN